MTDGGESSVFTIQGDTSEAVVFNCGGQGKMSITNDNLLFKDKVILTESNYKDYITDLGGDGGDYETDATFDTITTTKIQGPNRGEGQYNIVEFEDAIKVGQIWPLNEDSIIEIGNLSTHGTFSTTGDIYVEGDVHCNDCIEYSDKSLKENIRYIDNSSTYNIRSRIIDDVISRSDLHDFIVNQINLCEFNFIGHDRTKIGFIADDFSSRSFSTTLLRSFTWDSPTRMVAICSINSLISPSFF